MRNYFSQASDLEERGELEEASRYYLLAGMDSLSDADFTPDTTYRVGVTTLLLALSCDARSERTVRVDGIRHLLSGALDHAIAENDREDACLEGLFHEWRGDSLLMSGVKESSKQYERAARVYDDCPEGKQFSWGMEEEYDYAQWALQRFLDARNVDAREDLPPLEFETRIRTKIDLFDAVWSR